MLGEEKVEDKKILVTISEDRLEATVLLCGLTLWVEYTEEDIREALQENHIEYGIDNDKIREIIEKNQYNEEIVVAQGKKPQNGENGFFEFFFEQNTKKTPKILEDGSVDYGSMDQISVVNVGDELVRYHPATAGEPGINLFGEEIPALDGKELKKLRGKGFSISEDGNIYTSEINGKVEYKAGKLFVSNLLEIPGDVDLLVGDIDFAGDVHVFGNVVSNMRIKAAGSIIVEGYVEGAFLRAGKDVILKNGMQGSEKGMIEAGGAVCGKFFEHTKIRTQGKVSANAILSCDIQTGDEVIVSGKKGVLVGGIVRAVMGITATIVGNLSEFKTELIIGVNSNVYQEMLDLDMQKGKLEVSMQKMDQKIKRLTETSGAQNGIAQTQKLNHLKEKVELNQKYAQILARQEQIKVDLENAVKCKVVIRRNIYPGTKIMISGKLYAVKDVQTNVTIKKKGEEIIVLPNL